MKSERLAISHRGEFSVGQQSWSSWMLRALSGIVSPMGAMLQTSTRQRVFENRETRREADARVISGV